MTTTPKPPAPDRADRILDAATELLLRLGYRKVTIEDVARRAQIGKGTVYLHWRTKKQLFQAVLFRNSIAYLERVLQELRKDPEAALPHRLIVASYLAISELPVIRSLFGQDSEILQGLIDSPLRADELVATGRFFDILTRHGLVREDVPHLEYSFSATAGGFYLVDTLESGFPELDLQARAAAMAFVIREAFEPAEPPDPQTVAAAASELIADFAGLIPLYRKWIYTYDPPDAPG